MIVSKSLHCSLVVILNCEFVPKMSRRSDKVEIRWSIYDAYENSSELVFNGYWDVFGCAIFGHKIYVLPVLFNPQKVFVLDVQAKSWAVRSAGGDIPASISGYSLSAWQDKLLLIGSQNEKLESVRVLDTVLLEWKEEAVHGDPMPLVRYHAADVWEAKRMVLVNTRLDNDAIGVNAFRHKPNPTFTVGLDTMEVKKLVTKGPPPSKRYYHSSLFMPGSRQWLIICGQGPMMLLNDIYSLQFTGTSAPYWTRLEPFDKLQGVSVCSPVLIGSKLLIFGGVRDGLPNVMVCSYDLRTGEVEEGVRTSGNGPPSDQCSFQRVIQKSEDELYFVSSQKFAGLHRVHRGKLLTS